MAKGSLLNKKRRVARNSAIAALKISGEHELDKSVDRSATSRSIKLLSKVIPSSHFRS